MAPVASPVTRGGSRPEGDREPPWLSVQVASVRIRAYKALVPAVAALPDRRWELYKLLAEPSRLKLLALAAEEELAIGELAELMGEAQPNVSRHLKALRQRGLIAVRKEGTRVFARLAEDAQRDPVVADALRSGRGLCEREGRLTRIASVVAARDSAARDFFAEARGQGSPWPAELAVYLQALAPLIAHRELAIDVGTGDGSLLEVIAPIFRRVIAVDRSPAQLELARRRVAARAHGHVELVEAALGDDTLRQAAGKGADAVFAARVLHHAPRPPRALRELVELVRPGGAIVVMDYGAHEDERMRSDQADAWLGFDETELRQWAMKAGLVDTTISAVPSIRCGDGPDGHLDWQILSGRRPD